MKISLLVTTFNRPLYLRQTLESINASDAKNVDILIVDDCSTDPETLLLIAPYTVLKNNKNSSVKRSLLDGFSLLFSRGYDIVINLDSDALVRSDFIATLLNLHKKFPDRIVTGFNCNTLNKDGSIRHPIIEQEDGYNIKRSVGGINMLFTRETYLQYALPALEKSLANCLNWDFETCKLTSGIIVADASCVQHIGIQSSMGHAGGGELPDTSSDFKRLSLPNVTLIGIDGADANRLQVAADHCTKDILFGAVKLITDPSINSKEEYSRFCMKELYKHVDTDYMMVIQHDGYVLDASKWEPGFLQYDYIGAPWEWHGNLQVGNGGFSIRSRRLMEFVANDPSITDFHPEDDKICRQYGKYLQSKGFTFAPVELARRFSIEGYKSNPTYKGQFGFHGTGVKFTDNTKKLLVNQPHGLGDVIFAQTLIHSLGEYDVTWPVKDHFVEDLNRAYPQFNFIPESQSPVDLNNKRDQMINGFRHIPIRWSNSFMRVPYHHVMRAKYDMYRKSFKIWKERAIWSRDEAKEDALFAMLDLPEEYFVVNNTFGFDLNHKIDIPVNGVVMRDIEGFSLFDWAKVLEGAKEIHTVSTSILFILDLLETGPVHVYIRRPIEQNHDNYKYIFTDPKFIYK